MSIKDQIRAEIERQKKLLYIKDNDFQIAIDGWKEDAYNDILSFIDTLPEQPVEGLEEEYQEFCKDNPFPWSSQYVNREYIDELCLSIARHFAEWGRKQALQEIYEGKVKPVDKITAAWLDD